MSKVRDTLAAELAKRVSQHALVVWQDSEGEYADIAQELCPPDAAFARYDGSFYGLRRSIEAQVELDQPPKLLVYVPAPKPSTDDPLLEVRKASHEFARRLPTLIRDALKGELSEQRLAEVTAQARTLTDVEIALANGGGADVRLVRALGKTTDTQLMALRIFGGCDDEQVAAEAAWDAAAALLTKQFGGRLQGKDGELRSAAARQLLLTEIAAAIGELPDALRAAWEPVTEDQVRRTHELLARWRAEPDHRGCYVQLAREVDDALQLGDHIHWKAGLEKCISVPSLETAVFRHALTLLDTGAWADAIDLADDRKDSLWCRADGGDANWGERLARWRAVEATANLRAVLASIIPPSTGKCADVLSWYAGTGWQVDQAHRLYELARVELDAYGDLEAPMNAARSAYEDWLERVMLAASSAIESGGVDPDGLTRQGEIHDKWVRTEHEQVAYIWVDALRYELGRALLDNLAGMAADVTIHAAMAAAPTITPVGMANLTPSATTRLSLAVDAGKLMVRLDGNTISSVSDRVNQLRAAHGDQVKNLTLDDVAGQSEKELRRAIGKAPVVLVRSTEFDAQGERGMLQTAWPQFAQLVQMLARAIARLGHAGIRRVVVTADHGFVVLPRGLGADRSIDTPTGGTGELHRRGWIGHGGITTPSTLRVPLASTGTPGDADLIVPRGLAVFKGQGSKQFFHGGLSPQELVVPVVVADFGKVEAAPKLSVRVAVVGDRITTGTFAVKIGFDGDLFTNEVAVRAVAQSEAGGSAVARVTSGDGLDSATGVITLRSATSPLLAFQVTANLGKGDNVRVEVLDARTGLSLGSADAPVAARIMVEEDLI